MSIALFPDPSAGLYLILHTAYVSRAVSGEDPYFELVAALDHAWDAPRFLIKTRCESLYSVALAAEGSEARIAIPRADVVSWHRYRSRTP